MDGVLYRGNTAIDEAARAVAKFRDMGVSLVFITNNSSTSRSAYVAKLKRMGIPTNKSEIVSSGYATARYLRENSPRAAVYVVGEDGLKKELRDAGIRLVPSRKAKRATHVVVGIDRKLNYSKIAAGALALLNGADFIATNTDPTYPTERGLSPGAGATIGALSGCVGRGPRVAIGKPSPLMLEIAMEMVGAKAKETAVVGDRIDTDIMVGKKLHLRTILVMSGVSTLQDVKKVRGTKLEPDFVCKNLNEVMFG
jgi:HAD superfamily hydrolase (TIGR01457 family)